ncbi:MAG TPA: hypothetical protein VF508_10885, partial [Pyrinomonadaceae bacterium]
AALAAAPAAHGPAARRRSAAAAFREFFSLSPLWLRACAAAAALVLCALSALTLARAEVRWGADGLAFNTVGGRVVRERVEVPTQSGYTDEQVEAIVAQRVAEARAQFEGQRPTQVVEASTGVAVGKPQTTGSNAPRRKRAPRAGARRGEELLAEDDLPRLSDLLGGSY